MIIAGYHFKDAAIAKEALTHPSYASEHPGVVHYERLEFLGDAVLDLLISDRLLKLFPDESEGDLAKRRAALVCRDTLAKVATSIGLQNHMLLGVGEDGAGGRENPANLENTMEAFIAAIYVDGGLEAANEKVGEWFKEEIQKSVAVPQDPKTSLQEWTQAHGLGLPEYRFVNETGAAHAPEFTVEVFVSGYEPVKASAGNKKKAQRDAATKLFTMITGA